MQSTASTETAANAAELSADEILILRGTDEVAGAVAHLAAARLYALLTSDQEEPGVYLAWFDRDDACGDVIGYVTAMAAYVRKRQVQSAEQLYIHSGGKAWSSETTPYRQALDLFRVTVLSVAAGMEARRSALGEAERQAAAAKQIQPLKIEDSIFEPEDSMGDLLPHAVQALRDGARAIAENTVGKTDKANAPLSVGEPPAGHAKAKSAAKQQASKKPN